MPGDVPLRLFVSIELPDHARRVLAETIAALERAAPPRTLRPVRPEGVHITLKFLGATQESRVLAIIGALGDTATRSSPLSLQIGAPGYFGGRRTLRVAWLGVAGELDALSALAGAVDEAMAACGFERERRPFAAHLTLARVRDEVSPADRERIADALAALPRAEASWSASEIALMRSTLTPGGARYDALAHLPLGAPPSGPQP